VPLADADRPTAPLAAVVLAGGQGRRLGGVDKPALDVGGRSLLDRVLLGCPEQTQLVVVGPPRATVRPVRWTREEPPGGGPVAGLAAGLLVVDAPVVMVLAGDLPKVGAALTELVPAARAAIDAGRDGAWVVDGDGRGQPLVSCVATERLRAALPTHPRDRALHPVLVGLRLDPVTAPAGSTVDVDTPDDLAGIRQQLGPPGASRTGRTTDE
jgi:molybdopterin-guanine dinucleotide biosynthesis protein A